MGCSHGCLGGEDRRRRVQITEMGSGSVLVPMVDTAHLSANHGLYTKSRHSLGREAAPSAANGWTSKPFCWPFDLSLHCPSLCYSSK